MEPIPESAAVLAGLEATGAQDLAENVREVSRLVRTVVPECIGMSLSLLAESLTLTLVASGAEVAALDGVQYLEGGPCVDAIHSDDPVRTDDLAGRLDEEAWRVFATAGAAAGVLSTLSFPIRDEQGRVLGGVNLYAGRPHAFAGHEGTLIRMLGGWAADAMTNADLTFATRTSAREAPDRLAGQDVVFQAVGMLSVLDGVSADHARDRLLTAAAKAGVSAQELARTIIDGQIRDAGS
jgi:GAF domain-containing protein